MQLTPVVARPPAGLALKPPKPIAAKGTVPNRASYELLRRTNNPPSNVRRTGHHSCPAVRTKARDDEAEPDPQALEKQGEEAAVEHKRNRGGHSLACQIFEAVYVCAYILSSRICEGIAANAQDALQRLRGYVVDKFNRKR